MGKFSLVNIIGSEDENMDYGYMVSLKAARVNVDLSHAETAKKFGISKKTLQCYEMGGNDSPVGHRNKDAGSLWNTDRLHFF